MNQKEQEEAALSLITGAAEAGVDLLTAGDVAVNEKEAFTGNPEKARETLERLEDMGLVERTEADGGPFYRATGRAFRELEA